MSSGITGLHSGTMYNISWAIHELPDWIEMNIHQSLSVKDVVRRSGYLTFYLQHMFTSVTGEPTARYIRRINAGRGGPLTA